MTNQEFKNLTPQQQKEVKFKDLPKFNKISLVFFTVVVTIVFSTCIGQCVSDESYESDGVDTSFLYIRSETMAKKYVKSLLIAPSSAEFPGDEFKMWLLPDSSVVVKLAVDAQNAFGAMLRDYYIVKMKWYNDFSQDENWILTDIQNNQ